MRDDAIALLVMVALVAAVAGAVLSRLRPALAELCGGQDRGDLWTALCGACLVLGATLNALLAYGISLGHMLPRAPEPPPLAMVHGAIIGLLGGLAVTSIGVLWWTRRVRRGISPAPRPASRN